MPLNNSAIGEARQVRQTLAGFRGMMRKFVKREKYGRLTRIVQAPDGKGLLHTLTSVFAAASVEIKAATIGGGADLAVDRFEVTGRDGPRLGADERAQLIEFLAAGVAARPRRFRRGFVVSTPR